MKKRREYIIIGIQSYKLILLFLALNKFNYFLTPQRSKTLSNLFLRALEHSFTANLNPKKWIL